VRGAFHWGRQYRYQTEKLNLSPLRSKPGEVSHFAIATPVPSISLSVFSNMSLV
jgi:hypothetical protein